MKTVNRSLVAIALVALVLLGSGGTAAAATGYGGPNHRCGATLAWPAGDRTITASVLTRSWGYTRADAHASRVSCHDGRWLAREWQHRIMAGSWTPPTLQMVRFRRWRCIDDRLSSDSRDVTCHRWVRRHRTMLVVEWQSIRGQADPHRPAYPMP